VLKSAPKGTLSRIQAEIVAIRVSALNGCFY
jgi:AhpD family alkylhydroperoxidase